MKEVSTYAEEVSKMQGGRATPDTLSSDNPQTLLLHAPMSHFQIMGVAVVAFLCALDGFDVLAITFVAPALAQQWGIGRAQIGLLLSIGLLGMAGGSLLIAPAADVIGRRALVFLSLVTMIIGTSWTALAGDLSQMMWSRVLTGIGVGTMISVINPLAAEYANARRRYLTLSVINIGYPAGGFLGGLISAYLLTHFNWRAVFFFATGLSVVLLTLVWKWLPDPISFHIARPKPDALARVNDYLSKCGIRAVSALPMRPEGAEKTRFINLFGGDMRWVTLKVTCMYTLYLVTLFFMQSWVPSLVVNQGFTQAQGTVVSAMIMFGGIIGGLSIGLAATRFGLKSILVPALFIAAVMTALFGLVAAKFGLLLIVAVIVGFFLSGSMIGLYSVIWQSFPAHVRASGTGFSVGIGRIGAAISPLVAGLLYSLDFTRAGVSLLMALPAVLAALVLWSLPITDRT